MKKKLILLIMFAFFVFILKILYNHGFTSRLNYATAFYQYYYKNKILFYVTKPSNLEERNFLEHLSIQYKYEIEYISYEEFERNNTGYIDYFNFMEYELKSSLGDSIYNEYSNKKSIFYRTVDGITIE